MKELIGMAVFIVGLLVTGSYALKQVHDYVRDATLKKVSKGLPSLTKMTRALRGEDVK